MDIKEKNFILGTIILGLCFIIGISVASYIFYKVRILENTMVVTGSAKERVISDTVRWVAEFVRTVPINDLKTGMREMKEDEGKVVKFLKNQGIDEKEMNISVVQVEEPSRYDPNAPKLYRLAQKVIVNSNDVQKITNVAKNIQPLVDQGVNFYTASLEYYYSKLPELRIKLIAQAVEDAKKRAEAISQSTGRKIKFIKSANVGVVQVLSPNSVDISDYGTYDTATIEKEVMLTVKVEFRTD
jgi:hypothetical protein